MPCAAAESLKVIDAKGEKTLFLRAEPKTSGRIICQPYSGDLINEAPAYSRGGKVAAAFLAYISRILGCPSMAAASRECVYNREKRPIRRDWFTAAPRGSISNRCLMGDAGINRNQYASGNFTHQPIRISSAAWRCGFLSFMNHQLMAERGREKRVGERGPFDEYLIVNIQ